MCRLVQNLVNDVDKMIQVTKAKSPKMIISSVVNEIGSASYVEYDYNNSIILIIPFIVVETLIHSA